MGCQFFLKRFRPVELENYKPYTPKDSPEPLTLNKAILEGRVSRHWNILPSKFRLLTKEEKIELTGLYMIEREIENYNNGEQMRKLDRDRKS